MNMCVLSIKKQLSNDVAYLVVRRSQEVEGLTPIAIHLYLEDAEEMAGRFNQEMKERGIETINFDVITSPFYD